VPTDEPTGPFPAREFRTGKWRQAFTDEDLDYFFGIVPRDCWALYDRQGK